ncbi:MAG: hypothetical protein ACLTOP_00470 [Collinsella phocaeensis]|uniref:hypothetical protein n=1 Tax=Collinsella phocaeensis TaxID=1871016 RepID=UPI000A8FF9D4|nr:hypothetical protein [Collinsella phocaeensis]
MKRFKFVSALIASSLVLALVTGCTASTTSSLTFDVSTGDSVTVALDTSGGHKLVEEDGDFIVQQDGKTILQGSFLTQEGYDEQEAAIDSESVEVIEEADVDGNPYVFYEYTEDGTVNELFLLWIDGSHTGVLLGGQSGAEASQKAFDALTFSLDS